MRVCVSSRTAGGQLPSSAAVVKIRRHSLCELNQKHERSVYYVHACSLDTLHSLVTSYGMQPTLTQMFDIKNKVLSF